MPTPFQLHLYTTVSTSVSAAKSLLDCTIAMRMSHNLVWLQRVTGGAIRKFHFNTYRCLIGSRGWIATRKTKNQSGQHNEGRGSHVCWLGDGATGRPSVSRRRDYCPSLI
ncbi:MAG: hypothetical protein ACXWC8_23390, partial [Limisphaerales bacterium]